ncbi:MAG: hypothetical protein VZR73_13015, partial [Acutalibacteraceae bacterium]|nr:hypothetical protein [Acutalibacteraceae bacterium]
VTISSVSGSEDRIKLTDHHSTDNFSFRIEGNDFCIYDYDPETNSQTGGKIVLKNYKENTVKAIEFDDITYHFVTGNDTISNVSDTHSDRYVFLDNDWRNRETAGEPWEVTVEDFTPSGALDFRFLPNNERYYYIVSEADGQDMVLTYKYSPDPTTDATLGTIRLKNFFNADGTVNETTGFTKIRTVREVYSGNRGANAWNGWIWEQIRTDSGPQYRFLRLNAGTSGDDTVDLGAARPAGGASAWMYFAGAGDDTITAKEGDIVYGEAGADKILVSGHYGEAHGGIGNDTITIQSVNGNNRHHAVVRGDAGDDVINAYGSYHYINGGSGDDEIHIYSGENSEVMSHQNGISGSRGNDKIYIHAGDSHVANGGADNDEIYISGGNNTWANGGDGTDTITVSGGTGHVANGGTEGDVITVTGGTGHVLNGGVGSDRYVVDMDFTADTNLIVDQMNSDGADADILQMAKVNKDDVEFAVENGTLTITHSSGGTITVEGWGNHPLAQIQFADNQSMTADEINEQLGYVGRNGIDWTLGHTVILNAANLDPALQINGYKANDFVVTLNPDANQLVLADAQDGTITINNWDQNTLETITFTGDGYEDSFTADAFNDRIFTVTALENGTVYSDGTDRRQQFNLGLNASTDVTISSVSGSEDRIKLTDHHSTDNFSFRIEGNDFCIYDYDP